MGKDKLVPVAEVVWPDVAGRRGGFRRLGHSSSPRLPVGTKLYATPQLAEQQPTLAKYQPCGCVICTCEHETQCQGCGAKHCGTHPVGQLPAPAYIQPAEQETDPNPIKVVYIDGVGASRTSPKDCRDGVRYITVEDTVYWPLSDEDAQRLHSAACGRGEFTGPTLTRLHAAAPELLEALQNMVRLYYSEDRQDAPGQYARAAVAAIAKATGVSNKTQEGDEL